MKIGIITYHFPYNSGAALQCLALQTALQNLGHEVVIINYRPWYHQNRYTPKKNILYVMKDAFQAGNKHGYVKRIEKTLLEGYKALKFNMFGAEEFKVCEKKFSNFVQNYLNETRIYRTLEQLTENPPECDLVISGSDQLWNMALTKGRFDPAYFISFAPEKCRKVTYAVGANFPDDTNTLFQIKELIENLDAVSLREEKYLRSIKRASKDGFPLYQNIDPTLLLDSYVYERFEAPVSVLPQSSYILTYTMGDKSQGKVYAIAKKLGQELNLPVIDITGNPSRKNEIFGVNSVKAGPDEFLTYIKNAEYVITNSFHGTAFSVIYHKQFVVVPHSKTGNRVTDLLDRIGLNSRWSNDQETCVKVIKDAIDYSYVDQNINFLKKEAFDYLNTVCTK